MAEDLTRVSEIKVSVGQFAPLADDQLHSFVVDQDIDQPDMCVITVNNASHMYSNKVNIGDPVDVEVNNVSVFKGEVVGIEPIYKVGGETKCLIRAFNRLHRLLRGRSSQTFLDKKDSQIAEKIAKDNNLQARADTTEAVHPHVYQHNQTDLEFIRVLAARNGFEVIVEDKTLLFRKPLALKGEKSGIKLELNDGTLPSEGVILKTFSPRMSSAGIVSEVEVRGWDPEKKEEVVATAKPTGSKLGPTQGSGPTESAFGKGKIYSTDRPVTSIEEAQALADARLKDILFDYITGDGLCVGKTEKLKAGIVVEIVINPDDGADKFNGDYLIAGCSHRYKHSGAQGGLGATGGYTTMIRVKRDAENSGAGS